MITNQQYARLRALRSRGETIEQCGLKSGMSRKTAGKYLRMSAKPSYPERKHRTRVDPFTDVWPEVEVHLKGETSFEAKYLFKWLQEKYPDQFSAGQLRTFQRRVKRWRALEGPPREIYFPQNHYPGVLSESDFTDAKGLGVRIAGVPYDHMLYHFVLTYSNWEWATPCPSESFESLSHGFQQAVWMLGGVPQRHRTDRFTAAVTNLKDKAYFTARYEGLMRHYAVAPEKIQAACPNENGDVEQGHYRMVRAIDQALALRGSRDFATKEDYQLFLADSIAKRNKERQERFNEELKLLRPLPEKRMEECKKLTVRVSSASTIVVALNTYSVHSRLIGEQLHVRLYAEHLELYLGDKLVERLPRIPGRGKHRIIYRHIIEWLLRKPGAFENYVYRADLFPTTNFRIAYDRLKKDDPLGGTKGYLRLLKLAADESETLVDEALRLMIRGDAPFEYERIEHYLNGLRTVSSPADIEISEVDLTQYDTLLSGDYNYDFSEEPIGAQPQAPQAADDQAALYPSC